MEGASPGTDPTRPLEDAALESLVAEFLARSHARWAEEVAAFCEGHPGHAASIRRRLRRLEELGLARAAAGGPPAEGGGDGLPLRRIAHYELERELGRGGQGQVFLAKDLRLGRRVALKLLTAMAAGSAAVVDRFRREAEIASRLDHPGLCAIHDFGVENGVPYIAMRYVEGRTLARAIRAAREKATPDLRVDVETPETAGGAGEGPPTPLTSDERSLPFDVRRTVALIEKTARTLHAAHEAGVVHRDIKPSNIMVTAAGDPVILDFGLARELDGDAPSLTRSGDLLGTPHYMSPEQLTRHSIRLDRRSDVYSLGVVLYEALTLERPFDAPTREALYQAILVKPPPDPRRLNRSIGRDLKVILETALEKDPDRRYQTAEDFAEDLRRFRELEPIRARPIGPLARFGRWARRNPALASATLAAFVALAAGLAVALALLDARAAALARERRIADVVRQDELLLRADRLWPARPELLPAMDAWLAEARALSRRFAEHGAALDALRARALPYDDSDRRADEDLRTRLHSGLVEDLAALRVERRAVEDRLADGVEAEREARLRGRVAVLDRRIEALERDPRLTGRLTWRFADAEDAELHDLLGLGGEKARGLAPLIEEVAARRERAASLRARSIEGERPAWERALARINADPAFRGSPLAPQIGLVPLGRDRDSGLWEFWHVESGERPPWRGDFEEGRTTPATPAGIVLVLLPPAEARIGAQRGRPDGERFDPNARDDEGPPEVVQLDAFFIAKYETSQAQWQRVRDRVPSYYAADFRYGPELVEWINPVTNVTWLEAMEAARRLDLVLPSEAQWEHAARAGSDAPWWFGSDAALIPRFGNVADLRAARHLKNQPGDETIDDRWAVHAPSGTFEPNPFGLGEMVGNVAEWCRDSFVDRAELAAATGDGVRDDASIATRARRGGHFLALPQHSRSSARFGHRQGESFSYVGVRFARRVDR